MVDDDWIIEDRNLNDRFIIVTGTSRAGKTLLSKLLGSSKRIE